MKIRMKKYSGQAIAIIMVVLVVATVIGASLYSRMIKNRGEIVDTRESQRALEQADTILDTFISSDLILLQDAITDLLGSEDSYTFTSISELREFLISKGIDATIINDFGNTSSWCEDSTSTIEITVGYADANSAIEFDVGEVMAINVGGLTLPAGCEAGLTFTTAGSGDHLFTIKKVYMDSSENVLPYQLTHMNLYCLTSDSITANCGQGVVAPSTSPSPIVQKFTSGGSMTINLTEANLYEVRVIPLKEKLGIAMVPSNCGNVLNNYSVQTKVVCKGDSREKQVVIPNQNNMGYPAIFDYTIYNANGTLSPN